MIWRTGVTAVGLAIALAACSSRETITRMHGKSYRAAFERQIANAAPKAKPPAGLDSQEAAIVAESYRGSLTPPGKEVEDEPMLLVTPPRQQRTAPLAPSVPRQ